MSWVYFPKVFTLYPEFVPIKDCTDETQLEKKMYAGHLDMDPWLEYPKLLKKKSLVKKTELLITISISLPLIFLDTTSKIFKTWLFSRVAYWALFTPVSPAAVTFYCVNALSTRQEQKIISLDDVLILEKFDTNKNCKGAMTLNFGIRVDMSVKNTINPYCFFFLIWACFCYW